MQILLTSIKEFTPSLDPDARYVLETMAAFFTGVGTVILIFFPSVVLPSSHRTTPRVGADAAHLFLNCSKYRQIKAGKDVTVLTAFASKANPMHSSTKSAPETNGVSRSQKFARRMSDMMFARGGVPSARPSAEQGVSKSIELKISAGASPGVGRRKNAGGAE